jgi:hypothetical protein
MNVIRPEIKGGAGVDLAAEIRCSDRERLLEEAALDDGDRAGGGVVIVPAGVVGGRPAQHPHIEVRIAVQAHVVPLVIIESDVLTP